MVQRYNPDYVMHAARFAPFAREAEHGEYVKFSDYEALVSELASSRQINAQTLQVKLTMAETIKELTDRVNALDRQLSMSEAKCRGYFSDAAAALVKCDALAVENAALKSKAAELVHEASEVYSAYNATIREPDGDFMDMQTLHEMKCIKTPATEAALAAIEARGVEKFADRMLTLANDPTYSTASHRNDLRDAGAKAMNYAAELREAK